MEALYVALFLLPLIVDLCIGYDAYMNSHSLRKAMAWFFAGVVSQVLVGLPIL
ncbi:hypothetical protein [Selenomonas ruminantium]|uniref:Uncharacterized protein n=1 Tax=Selenomonas ruminantium TaxID=971 RepID=A0A1I0WPE4_SELRU|nr:hypothetical protein [Selenomonas ruminantium]SFA90481.1 hypothetical protein SAMN05216587_103176 [Selenomonas ruminantium]